MLSRIQKMTIVLFYNIVFLCGAYSASIEILSRFGLVFRHLDWDLLLIGIFSAVYFILMWKNLYSHSYHYYLKSTMAIVVRNLLASAVSVFIFGLLTELFRKDGFAGEKPSFSFDRYFIVYTASPAAVSLGKVPEQARFFQEERSYSRQSRRSFPVGQHLSGCRKFLRNMSERSYSVTIPGFTEKKLPAAEMRMNPTVTTFIRSCTV